MFTQIINFDIRNPWGMISDGLKGVNRAHGRSTDAILGTSAEPIDENKNRHELFKFIMAFLRGGYMYEDKIYQRTKVNKKQEAKTQNLSLPAEITVA